MGKLADILNKRVKDKIDDGLKAFGEGLVEDGEHPVLSGITRGNWHPSTNSPRKISDYYGYSLLDVLDAWDSGRQLVSLSEAKDNSTNFDWDLGDKVIWTNSLDHILELEFRRKFFDKIVENAKQKAQRAVKGGTR